MLKVFCCIFILFFSFHTRAQDETDSLKVLLSGDLADTTRIQVLNALAPRFFYKDPRKTDSLATLAIKLSESADYPRGMAVALRFKGISYAIRGNFDQAREYYFEALQILENSGIKEGRPDLYYAIGITYTETGKYELAEGSYRKALVLQKSFSDSLGMANSYVGLGNFHKKINQFTKSALYLDSAAAIYNKLDRPSELAIIKNNQANLYISMSNYPKALEYAHEALAYNEREGLESKSAVNYHTIGTIYGSLDDLEKAAEYYLKSYKLKKKLGMGKGMSLSLSNLGAMYLQKKEYEKSKETFLQARHIYDSLNMACNLPYTDLSLGTIFQQTGKKDSAYFYLNRALKGSEACQSSEVTAPALIRLGEMYMADLRISEAERVFLRALELGTIMNLLPVKQDAASQLYELYKRINKPLKAFKYLEITSTLKDSLYNEENARKIARLESKYEFDKERIRLDEQYAKEKLRQQAEVERQILIRDTAIVVASLLLALAIGTIVFYFKLRHSKKLLSVRNQKITSQKEKLEELNQTNDKLLSLLSHDLRSPLHGMQSLITLWKDQYLTKEELDQISTDVEIRIGNLLQFLDNILSWSKNNFSKLTARKEKFDLNTAITDTILLLQPNANLKKVKIRFNPDKKYQVVADEVMLKTVFRNILSNAIKYSNEDNFVDVDISSANEITKITFTDYGVGVPEHVRQHLFVDPVTSKEGTGSEMGAGIGLFLSHDFVNLHQGKIELISEATKGSTFVVSIPTKMTE